MRSLPGIDAFPDELNSRLATATAGRHGERPRTRHLDGELRPHYTNRLALESSPYLLQHAHNPVNWYPWGDDAFAEAKRLGRLVFLSIGYSTCHWCHVMEEESFEDETIASFLNAHFIPIKADREERPDVDAVYMRAAQQINGSGGWPLSVWLTKERQPLFAGTYFPPYAGLRGAGPGFLEILTELVRLWDEEPLRVREAAQALTNAVRLDLEMKATPQPSAPPRPDTKHIAAAVEQCRRVFDEEHGGLRLPQKFPSHVPIRLLLRHHQRTGDTDALHMAVRTLEGMATGGIYDQVAGGFHRYATDSRWLVPHFEKMLYDNALLVVAYAEAWQVTKRADFARVVRETCDELLATFASPEGTFYSATDADSEGEEGKFFVWNEAEIRALLGPGDNTELFLRHYGVSAGGNFEIGNILYQPRPDEGITQRLAPARAKLAQARKLRIPPLRDVKSLAAWNGLAVSAFAFAFQVLDDRRYLDAGLNAAEFLLRRMRIPVTGRMARSYCEGHLGVPGFLDDYAFVAAGLLDLFESSHDPRWFDEACRLCDETESLFADEDQGGWFLTSREHEPLLARERPTFDGAEPAGSSVALMNAVRLATYTDQERWRQVADRALKHCLPHIEEQPMTMGEALLAVDFRAGPIREIVLALPASDATSIRPFQEVLRNTFCPRKVLVVGEPTSPAWQALEARIPLLKNKTTPCDRVTAYVCTQGHCELPTSDPELFTRQIA
jgi:uncharacterized protein YyaL (SSP411 family)